MNKYHLTKSSHWAAIDHYSFNDRGLITDKTCLFDIYLNNRLLRCLGANFEDSLSDTGYWLNVNIWSLATLNISSTYSKVWSNKSSCL